MFSTQFIPVTEYLQGKVSDGITRKYLASVAAGMAVARQLPLPSSPVEYGPSYYDASLIHTAQSLLGEINEKNFTLDLDLAFDVARTYWLVRYGCAHPEGDDLLPTKGPGGFLAKAFGVSHYLNPEVQAFCDKYDELVVAVVNRLTLALKQGL